MASLPTLEAALGFAFEGVWNSLVPVSNLATARIITNLAVRRVAIAYYGRNLTSFRDYDTLDTVV